MSTPGSGGVASASLTNVQRRERMRQLAMEVVDLSKDPYFMKNHLGSYECKLCLTLHTNEGSYLSHTQGKRHQQNMARRAARQNKGAAASEVVEQEPKVVKTPKIGLPEHYVYKVRDPLTDQLGLVFIIKYPRINAESKPCTRFMSAVEQRVETPDLNYQYILFAAEPYNVLGFKVPNMAIDRSEDKTMSNWNEESNIFSFQLVFESHQ